ncbi:MoaD/ThiS family protein, partial [Candidatus Bathyarchaeota archaeon]|nr:MoaD/ThiS family protein [Candidatus Bathyarchaeota archaeon]
REGDRVAIIPPVGGG